MCIQTHSNAFERILTHHDAFVCIHKRVASNGKARELLTTSGGAPKPEPELWVRVAQQARALGDLAGSIVCMWIVEVLGANPYELPCESSLESTRRLLCMYVWSTSPAHLCAFVCILTHHVACIMLSSPRVASKSGSSAVVNWNTNLCT